MRSLVFIIFILLFLLSNKKKQKFTSDISDKNFIKNECLESITLNSNGSDSDEYTTLITLIEDHTLDKLPELNENVITLAGIDKNEIINFLKYKLFRTIMIKILLKKDISELNEAQDKLNDNEYGTEYENKYYFTNWIKIQNKLYEIIDEQFQDGENYGDAYYLVEFLIDDINTKPGINSLIRSDYTYIDTEIKIFNIGTEVLENSINEFLKTLPSLNCIINIIIDKFYLEVFEEDCKIYDDENEIKCIRLKSNCIFN